MRPLAIIAILFTLIATQACKHTSTVTPANPNTNQSLTPQDYAAMHTSKMSGIRKWAIRYTSSKYGQPPKDTTTYGNLHEVIIINNTTIFFNKDTLLFAPESIVAQGVPIDTDTSKMLSYYYPHTASQAQQATFLTYYYKEDSITYSTRKIYPSGGDSSYWNTHK